MSTKILPLPEARQEAFSRAYAGLRSQGFTQSKSREGLGAACLYTDHRGRHCAVGWILTEEAREAILNCADPDKLPNESSLDLLREEMPGDILSVDVVEDDTRDYRAFLTDLQRCHDTSEIREDMKSGLMGLASRYGLTIPE